MVEAEVLWNNSNPPKFQIKLFRRELTTEWGNLKHIDAGLINVGQTCFLNSSIQALFHIPSFVDFLEHNEKHRKSCFTLLKCVQCALYRTFLNMSLHKTSKPMSLVHLLRRTNRNMSLNVQQDAHEFLVSLLDVLHEEMLEKFQHVKIDYCSKFTTAINQMFTGWSKMTATCIGCKKSRSTHLPSSELFVRPMEGTLQNAVDLWNRLFISHSIVTTVGLQAIFIK